MPRLIDVKVPIADWLGGDSGARCVFVPWITRGQGHLKVYRTFGEARRAHWRQVRAARVEAAPWPGALVRVLVEGHRTVRFGYFTEWAAPWRSDRAWNEEDPEIQQLREKLRRCGVGDGDLCENNVGFVQRGPPWRSVLVCIDFDDVSSACRTDTP